MISRMEERRCKMCVQDAGREGALIFLVGHR